MDQALCHTRDVLTNYFNISIAQPYWIEMRRHQPAGELNI